MNNFCQLSNICCLLYTRIFNTYVCAYFVYLITTVYIFLIVNQFSIEFLADIFIFFLIFEVSFYHSKIGSIGRRLIVAATFYKIQEV